MILDCSQDVANDLENLLENDEKYDVIIYVGRNEDIKEVHAHSLILRTRSQYFRTAFSEETSMIKDGKYIFKKPDIKPLFLKIILRFIYCGKADLSKLQEPDILDLLIVASEFEIPILIQSIQQYLIKYHEEFLIQNRVGILEYFYQNESVIELWKFCLESICEKPEIFFNSNKFFRLKGPLLELLLKRDDLSSNEINIWESLIKWCLAQHSDISVEVQEWSKKDIATLENTIHRFIPLIRFYEMSSDDFLSKVYPYRDLLPKDLINNVLIFHMDSNTKLNMNIKTKSKNCVYDSVLIKPRHFAIIASWIEKKNEFYETRNLPYNFKLLYRASSDGNTAAKFHELCDNKGANIVIAKIANSEKLVGGYNPLYWDSNKEWNLTLDSFIFSSINRDNLQNISVSYSNDEHSIYCDSLYGPSFGSDLVCLNNGAWRSKPRFYQKIDAPLDFDVEDYEVFQVIKKL